MTGDMATSVYANPVEVGLRAFEGATDELLMMDVDSDEMIPSSSWSDVFGDVGADMAQFTTGILGQTTRDNSVILELKFDSETNLVLSAERQLVEP